MESGLDHAGSRASDSTEQQSCGREARQTQARRTLDELASLVRPAGPLLGAAARRLPADAAAGGADPLCRLDAPARLQALDRGHPPHRHLGGQAAAALARHLAAAAPPRLGQADRRAPHARAFGDGLRPRPSRPLLHRHGLRLGADRLRNRQALLPDDRFPRAARPRRARHHLDRRHDPPPRQELAAAAQPRLSDHGRSPCCTSRCNRRSTSPSRC